VFYAGVPEATPEEGERDDEYIWILIYDTFNTFSHRYTEDEKALYAQILHLFPPYRHLVAACAENPVAFAGLIKMVKI